MLYSLAGAAVIFMCGVEISRRLNEKITADHQRIEKYILLLRYVRSQIDCFALPIGDILGRADSVLLAGCGWEREEPPSSVEDMLGEALVEDEDARGILLEFCKDFGKSYLDEQIRRCDHYISLLDERRNALAKDLPRKKKLNSTLCISGAVAVIILLI